MSGSLGLGPNTKLSGDFGIGLPKEMWKELSRGVVGSSKVVLAMLWMMYDWQAATFINAYAS